MRNAIYEYLEPDIDSKKELWESAVFVFDTNVLLNLYRYTQKTRNSLIDSISSFQDRIWMPQHVATEFMKNRCKTIFETVGKFESLEKDINKFVNVCKDSMRANDDNPEIMELKLYLNKWVEKYRNNNLLVEKPSEDQVLNRILELYDKRVGRAFSEDELKEICEEGEKRYKDQVPPGFKDAGKSENAYGDLILWKEIIRYSDENQKDIIFITHDEKEDWWNKYNNKKIGPHVKLRKEFIESTKKKFGMYTMHNFIKIYNESKIEKFDQSVINEVNTIGEKKIGDMYNKYKINDYKDKINEYEINEGEKYRYSSLKSIYYNNQFVKAAKDIERCKMKIDNKMKSIMAMEKKYEGEEMPAHVKEQFENTENNMYRLEGEFYRLKDHYLDLKKLKVESCC